VRRSAAAAPAWGRGRAPSAWACGLSVAVWALSAGAQSLATGDSDTAGAIIGRVCRDLDGDGLCGADEPGVPGARVVLETGQQAITDAQGRYHLAAVPARAPSLLRGAHLEPGRHRVKLDTRSLSPTSRVTTPAATVEVPMAGLVLQDFAVTEETSVALPVRGSPEDLPPSGRLEKAHAVRFTVTGVAGPADRVEVSGILAKVDPSGGFSAPDVPLVQGANDVQISAASPSGAVRYFRQRIDVIPREDGVLVVPREMRSIASLQLPASEGQPAATGPVALTLQAPPGTHVTYPGGESRVEANGAIQVPVDLASGHNVLSLTVQAPGGASEKLEVSVDAEPRAFVVGLLDLEAGWTIGKTPSLYGRGGVHAEVPLGSWHLTGELELSDQDLADVQAAGAQALLGLRQPDRLERALNPERYPTEWGDDSAGIVPNPGEARLRLELSHSTWGRIGVGTNRAEIADGEVGRYQRELFGPFLDLHTPSGTFQVGAKAFGAPGWIDPVDGIALLPAHEELSATGGSVYYLGHQDVAEGSEVVRVEVRDGLGGVPLAERHLVRGRDYEIDYRMGRILLAQPLSFVAGTSVLGADPLTSSPQNVLVVEYEHDQFGAPGRPLGGGEVIGNLGPVKLSAGAVDEAGSDPYLLLRGRGSVSLGLFELSGEYAHSKGLAIQPGDFSISDDGGLSFLNPPSVTPSSGDAWGVRLKGPGFGEGGFIDASYRARSAGFSDSAHEDTQDTHQGSVRVQQQFGHIVVNGLFDDRLGADPRDPFGTHFVASRTVGASVGYRTATWELRVEGRDGQLAASQDPTDPSSPTLTGGRTSAGLFGRYRLTPWLALIASHNQVLAQRGSGPGAYDNTFSSVGAEISPTPATTVGVRGGWGPSLGPQAWVDGQLRQGVETHYGSYSVDVDGPDVGQRRMVTGSRTEIGDTSSVFVEDVSAHDATAVRMSRAVGITEGLAEGLEVTGRYERGVDDPLDIVSPLTRDAAGATLTFNRKRFRLFARGEYRFERGQAVLGPPIDVHRIQWLGSAGVHVDLAENLTASGRVNVSQTTNLGLLEARFVDANAGVAWRKGPWALILHYGLTRNLPPPSPTNAFQGELVLQTITLQPALHVGQRFTLSGGANLGWSSLAGTNALVLSASLRPSVRVVGGLELAAEVARRSSAPDGGELNAVRAEAGYRIGDPFLMALGFTVLGYSGLGVDPTARQDSRIYLRGEVAY
jgi:hypothetical protein